MTKKNSLFLNAVFIFVGGGILVYAFTQKQENKYVEIIGLVIIMFGLYRATNLYSEEKKNEEEDGL